MLSMTLPVPHDGCPGRKPPRTPSPRQLKHEAKQSNTVSEGELGWKGQMYNTLG